MQEEINVSTTMLDFKVENVLFYYEGIQAFTGKKDDQLYFVTHVAETDVSDIYLAFQIVQPVTTFEQAEVVMDNAKNIFQVELRYGKKQPQITQIPINREDIPDKWLRG